MKHFSLLSLTLLSSTHGFVAPGASAHSSITTKPSIQMNFLDGLFGGNKELPPDCFRVDTAQYGDGVTYPKKGDTVKAHYVGLLEDGTQFDTSRGFLKAPFEFKIGEGQVIKGWDEGIIQMSKGEKAYVTCPPEKAYGKEGVPGIPGGSTLYFLVDLIDIIPAKTV